MRILRTLVAVGAAALLATGAASAAEPPPPSARAVAYGALLPSGTYGATVAATGGRPSGDSSTSGLRPAGGGHIGSLTAHVRVAIDGSAGLADGQVDASDLSLFEGRVTIGSLRVSATARGGAARVEGATVSGLTVDGRPVPAGAGSRVEVPGIGTLVFMESSGDGPGGVQVNALRVAVTDPSAAAVVGQPFVIGHLELNARDGTPVAATTAATTTRAPRAAHAPTTSEPVTTAAPSVSTTPSATGALGLPRRAAPPVTFSADRGYVFPVAGETGYSDDYGSPRAGTGWHHGNDIFAARGTPVLAVTDGTLDRVGVNTLGGNRLWLIDGAGNAFYYAHLSAYAPDAVEGARVHAGQVIGFVGNTGQAITTPPHLHFEIHPGGGDSIDPYPFLRAWQHGGGIPRAFRQAALSASPVPAVGAVLVNVTPARERSAPGDGLATPAE